MLSVETFEPGGKSPAVTPASRVLVKDRFGNPVAVVIDYADDQLIVAHAADPDFEVLVKTLGVNAAVVRTHLAVSDP